MGGLEAGEMFPWPKLPPIPPGALLGGRNPFGPPMPMPPMLHPGMMWPGMPLPFVPGSKAMMPGAPEMPKGISKMTPAKQVSPEQSKGKGKAKAMVSKTGDQPSMPNKVATDQPNVKGKGKKEKEKAG